LRNKDDFGTLLDMKRIIWLFLLVVLPLSGVGLPSFLDNVSEITTHETYKNLTPPNPYDLNPQWWHYYDGDEGLLAEHIEETTNSLQKLFDALSYEDQQIVLPLINSFNVSLAALANARAQKVNTPPFSPNLQTNYTLEQQLQLHQQWRKLQLEIKTDRKELEELKSRIAKLHKILDSWLVSYLKSDSKPTSARMIAGLEIMSQRAAIAIAEENQRLLQKEIEAQEATYTKLENQLAEAHSMLDVSLYDEDQLKQDIQSAQVHYEKRQKELSKAEAYAIAAQGGGHKERANKHLLAQKAVQSSANEALAWTNLAFHKLRYNLIMHVNQRFQIDNSEMRERLSLWKGQLDQIRLQQGEWEKLALQEQDRIRQDDEILIANNEQEDVSLTRVNQARRQVTSETITVLQHLHESIANVQWLINQLYHHIRLNSHFWERWWADLTEYGSSLWHGVINRLNISLFKIYDIPITPLTLFRILIIFLLSYGISMILRYAIHTVGKKRNDLSESMYYKIGRLVHYFVLSFGALIALWSVGLDFSNLMILMGALSLGIGIGLQSVAMNFLAGLRILFDKKIKIGDYIELSTGHYGKVTEIHVQNTVICTTDGIEVVVPNSELLNTPLINWTMNNDFRRLHIPFAISYDNDKERVRKIISEAAKKVPCIIHDSHYSEPQVWLVKFGDHSLDFELVVWVNYKAKSWTDSKEADFLWVIESTLRENQIKLPLPQQFMYLKHVPNEANPLPKATL
jgi:potassium-dependent mechanosensitive channel